MGEAGFQNPDTEVLKEMDFQELQKHIDNLLVECETRKVQKLHNFINEYEINELISLLESKVLSNLITKEQKSVEILQKEIFRLETRRQNELSRERISKNKLSYLYKLRDELLDKDLDKKIFEQAFLQMCKLPSEFFDYHIYRDPSSIFSRLARERYLKFSRDLPFLVNQAIEKAESKLKKRQELERKPLTINDFEDTAIQLFKQEVDQKSNGEVTKRYEQIVALRSKKKKIFAKSIQDITVKKLPWKFFPEGQWTVEQIVKEFEKFISHDEVVDESRIWKIYDNLNPTECYVSQEGFNRYIAFCFEWANKVVLECPIYGNAIYVIKGDWKEITKLHKWQAKLSHQVTVIRHNDTWFNRLKSNLRSPY